MSDRCVLAFARAGGDRRGAVESGEAAFGEASDVTHLHDDLCRGTRCDADERCERRVRFFDQLGELGGGRAMVCSERYAYGGTADAFVEIAGETWLLDYKTGASVYPDSALQLAGLARAQFIGYPGDPVQYPVPYATRFGILHVRPEGARLYPVTVDRETVAAFLDARRLYGWDQGPARTVIGEPLPRASRPAAA